ncbi:hypothetical protein C8R45DRAFT_1111895 [Mycena sanguinolenta]|nr:hypothetical protein C8R45DRAFT_1111895 [Mycena sanguinolenta]
MSTEQHNNGDATPPDAPSGGKGKAKETEEQEDERIAEQAAERARRREAERLERERQCREDDEEKNQHSLKALMHYLDVETKLTTAKLESLQYQHECAGALSQDVVARTLDLAGEAELVDLLRGLLPLADEVPDELNDESTSDEDEYEAPMEKDGGKKRGRAEKASGRKGKARPEKRKRTETKKRTETEDAELARLDEREEWIIAEESCHLCTIDEVQCLRPPQNSRMRACRYCRLRKQKCTILPENQNRPPMVRRRVEDKDQPVAGPSRLGGQSSVRRVPEVRVEPPVRRTTRNTDMQRAIDAIHHRMDRDQALLQHLADRVIQQDPILAWPCQYLRSIGEIPTDRVEYATEEDDEDEKRVRPWAKNVGRSEGKKEETKKSSSSEGSQDPDGASEEKDGDTVDGPSTFGPFVATSSGEVFHLQVPETTVVVKTEEEENGVPPDNEEDLVQRGKLRKKVKANTKAKAKEAEKTTEEGVETVVKTEGQEPQVPVPVQRPAPRVVQAPGVFFETATSTGKLFPVQVEMIEVLDSDDAALAP